MSQNAKNRLTAAVTVLVTLGLLAVMQMSASHRPVSAPGMFPERTICPELGGLAAHGPAVAGLVEYQ